MSTFVMEAASPEQKVFITKEDAFVGDCMIGAGAKLIIRADGTANWVARGRSTDTNDTLKVFFYFIRADGSKVFPDIQLGFIHIPRFFTVQPLEMPNSGTWYDWGGGFTFPAEGFALTDHFDWHIQG